MTVDIASVIPENGHPNRRPSLPDGPRIHDSARNQGPRATRAPAWIAGQARNDGGWAWIAGQARNDRRRGSLRDPAESLPAPTRGARAMCSPLTASRWVGGSGARAQGPFAPGGQWITLPVIRVEAVQHHDWRY